MKYLAMVKQVVLKFAKITNSNLPSEFLEKIHRGINNKKVKAQKPYRKGFLFAKRLNDGEVFTRVYDENYEKDPLLDEDNLTPTEVDNLKGQFKEIIFFKNGYFVYQTSKKSYFFDELKRLIVDAWESVKGKSEPSLEFTKIDAFPPKLLKHFYEDEAKQVSFISLRDIGSTEPNPAPISREIADMIGKVGKDANVLEVKSRKHGNLQKPKLLKQIVTISKVIKVRGVDAQALPFTITSTGRISIYVPDEEDERISKIKRICRKVFSFFLQ